MEQMIKTLKALLFEEKYLQAGLPLSIEKEKKEAAAFFLENEFPSIQQEDWKYTHYDKILNQEDLILSEIGASEEKFAKCNIPIDAVRLSLLNGFYKGPLMLSTLANGVVVGSLAKAMEEYPEIVEKYYGKALKSTVNNGFLALNTALSQDGLFIYIPENVHVEKPMQMLNVIFSTQSLFIQTRNLVIVEKNSSLQLIHCDDSYNHHASFSNHVTEIFVGENAKVEHYKMQNLNDNSGLLSLSFIDVSANANVITHAITLNGGLIRNQTNINLNGEGSLVDSYGLYLMDKDQSIDNIVSIKHNVPHCQSSQLYKGILDGNAKAAFNGHILVKKHAVGTQAFQNSKNLLLTEKAKIITQPFLEIYNDDVKCSHGATTGQLDTNALFYIRSRGIGERMAKMLLMSAYCNEVVGKINIETLKEALSIIVEKRLKGDLQICSQCALNCSSLDCKGLSGEDF